MTQPPSPESQQIFRPELFAGQVALVTGGGTGIGLATARELTGKSPDSLYAQRCLALASRGMGDYYARLARRGPAAAREDSLTEAGVWYRKALAIWSEWRGRGVALPYSANREREILKLLQEQPVYSSRAASLAK